MPPYEVIDQTVVVGGESFQIRVLKNRNQYDDPDGSHEAAGVAPASWPMFGKLWPAGLILAELMARSELHNLRILELGCGLGLASMMAMRGGAEVVASDVHPLAEEFLAYNTARNGIDDVDFRQMDWRNHNSLGQFDLIMGSDILYEPAHPLQLAKTISRHALPVGRAIIADAGRGLMSPFKHSMADRGWVSVTDSVLNNKLVRLSRRVGG